MAEGRRASSPASQPCDRPASRCSWVWRAATLPSLDARHRPNLSAPWGLPLPKPPPGLGSRLAGLGGRQAWPGIPKGERACERAASERRASERASVRLSVPYWSERARARERASESRASERTSERGGERAKRATKKRNCLISTPKWSQT